MSEIKAFLIDHPGISVRWLEQQVSVPLGTIRITGVKPIPEKYVQPIIDVLLRYGYMNDDVHTSDQPTASMAKTYIIRNNVIGNMDGLLFRRVSLPDNTILIAQ